jgi:hypothetical protein
MLQAATHENRAEVMQKFFAKFEGKFFIGGDFNGRHHSWGNSKKCSTGNNLFHCITEAEISITLLNDGSQTYLSDATGSKAALDLTFVDPRTALLFSWKALGMSTIFQFPSSVTAQQNQENAVKCF